LQPTIDVKRAILGLRGEALCHLACLGPTAEGEERKTKLWLNDPNIAIYYIELSQREAILVRAAGQAE
jgi:hypothetical protein